MYFFIGQTSQLANMPWAMSRHDLLRTGAQYSIVVGGASLPRPYETSSEQQRREAPSWRVGEVLSFGRLRTVSLPNRNLATQCAQVENLPSRAEARYGGRRPALRDGWRAPNDNGPPILQAAAVYDKIWTNTIRLGERPELMELDESRDEIDALDEQLLELLAKRAGLAKQIGQHKRQQGQPAYDPSREAQILRRLTTQDTSPLPAEAVRAIYQEILSASRALQEPLRVAFLGPEHTFSHLAARQQFGVQAEFVPAAGITDIFTSVERGNCNLGVVPIENSTGGVVPETLDCFLDTSLTICNELYVPIHLYLVANCELDEVTTLYTNPQPLAQCRVWLRENLPRVTIQPTASTAGAAQAAADDPTGAALAPGPAAQAYGLEVLAAAIEDTPNNRTRFFVVSPQMAAPTGRDKTSIVFSTAHHAGALHQALGPLAMHGINMTFIQSRPARGRLWEYVFFVDFEGHHSDEEIQKALQELQEHCPLLKMLGSYPAAE